MGEETDAVRRCEETGWLVEGPVAVLEGFGEVVGFDDSGIIKVGDGASQFEDTVEGAGGEVKLFHSGAQQALSRWFHFAELFDLDGGHLGIAVEPCALEALLLDLPGGFDTCLDCG